MTTIPTQRIYEGYLLSGDRRVFFVRHFGTFCNVGCSVGFHCRRSRNHFFGGSERDHHKHNTNATILLSGAQPLDHLNGRNHIASSATIGATLLFSRHNATLILIKMDAIICKPQP